MISSFRARFLSTKISYIKLFLFLSKILTKASIKRTVQLPATFFWLQSIFIYYSNLCIASFCDYFMKYAKLICSFNIWTYSISVLIEWLTNMELSRNCLISMLCGKKIFMPTLITIFKTHFNDNLLFGTATLLKISTFCINYNVLASYRRSC
jgi:hypothetical protein